MSEQSENADDNSGKRLAMTGQWKTPPVPMFAANFGQQGHMQYQPQSQQQQHQLQPQQQQQQQQQQQHQQALSAPVDLQAPTSIPNTSEDYAKALQEAYRKGAQAAAMMAQQQQHQDVDIPTAASCPNFQRTTVLPHQATAPQQVSGGIHAEESAYSMATASPMSAAPAAMIAPAQHHVAEPLRAMPPPSLHQPTISAYDASHHASQGSEYLAPGAAAKPKGRSVSMPDMSEYTAQAEEEKRQKRLARNRASARLRRLRKKNLVDAYETEVGVLEKTLKQLRAHEWGKDDDHKALLDALGMERGQQTMEPNERSEIIRDILEQQIQQVDLLRQAQMEQECLHLLVDDPDDELAQELQSVLMLNDVQKQEIQNATKGLSKEVEALETVAASLKALQDNEWLVNDGVQKITDQFTSILHKNQVSKLLLWTDANVEAIDQLDCVQVQPLQSAPIFSFGVEATPIDEDEK